MGAGIWFSQFQEMMEELHEAFLSLGSNIDPEKNLPEAVQRLGASGRITAVSSVWQSHAVGSRGPDFLNTCLLFLTPLSAEDLIRQVLRSVEAALGRQRGPDKNAPRTIDIDLILYDEEPYGEDFWSAPFVIVPLAELLPDYPHPRRYEDLETVARRMRKQTWMVRRPEVLTAI